jgi:hypothetical protein
MKRVLSIFVLTALLTGTAIAQRMGPPQEALDACSGHGSGDSCNFEGKRGDTVSGTCGSVRGADKGQLVCMPSNNRGGQGQMGDARGKGESDGVGSRREPPPEALSACEGGSEGKSCSFSGPRGETLSGTCRRHDDELACAPGDRPAMR